MSVKLSRGMFCVPADDKKSVSRAGKIRFLRSYRLIYPSVLLAHDGERPLSY